MALRLLLAIATSVAVVLSGPFVGSINTSLMEAFPGQHLLIVGAAVGAPALIGLGLALARIRERRLLRYGLLAAAALVALSYIAVMQPIYTERFHLTEYAVITVLFYRVWRPREDLTTLMLPVCAAFIAGIADEWFQWFIPSRVGELRDVLLNGAGIATGLLFAAGLNPPAVLRLPADDRSRRALAAAASALLATIAIFLQSVHLGFEIVDGEIGRFRSRFSAATLHELAADRPARWLTKGLPAGTISREDHYLSEAMFHIQERNELFGEGDLHGAWKENRILERFYAPALDIVMQTSRWPAEQRAVVAAGLTGEDRSYVSDAYPLPIYAWNRFWFWTVVIAAIGAIAAWSRRPLARSQLTASV
jgi:hypothetical protein